ncbi:hypothetical protein CQY20_27580 [Mycolicibacterium agri]|uniref:Uncharacterized protein n=1 Tax=Mycolicibacterium agri TaxID=36811 RepID=A0A2A7MSC4_MYCAG|nr:hypothetical protein [Mycolicibacterium agri]PEG34038.1 hypothetical protein CQY20_27580 [Mycolicibacterium agri]GFG48989.1 hypothetical protein MAGR_04300 [Mycolicibacterium agri]
MKLSADSGLWSTGPVAEPMPVVAVLEVSGAVLSWAIDDDAEAASFAFTDLARADWLWRVFGEDGHSAVAAAVRDQLAADEQTVDVAGVGVVPGSVDRLRRLALGHWMRRWWPASHRDGIAALGAALLDAEIALLTAAAQDFFPDDTFDSDVAELLTPHEAALNALVRTGDPRVVELVQAAVELTDEVGIALAEPVSSAPRRDDYALAAGTLAQRSGEAIAGGTASLAWAAVPPAVFDAAENTIEWRVDAVDSLVNATVSVELLGPNAPDGIAVRLRAQGVRGAGALARDGRASFPLLDEQQRPISETAAWNHDWRAATVTVGADVEESAETRDRVRAFARARLAEPPSDAFLAEILAAESDY